MPNPDGTETPEEKAARKAQTSAPGQAPTGFVNFQRRFNANRDVAKREADKYTAKVQGSAETARNDLQKSQAGFASGVNTGTVQGPGGAPSTNTGAAAVPPLNAAPVAPATQAGAPPAWNQPPAGPKSTPEQIAWDNARFLADKGQGVVPSGPRPPDAPTVASPATGPAGPTMAEMLAKARQQYSGPNGLDDKSAATSALAAQQQLNLLGSNRAAGISAESNLGTLINESGPSGDDGADNLSAALVGSAGRKQFDALRAKFNPNKELADAQAAAIATAKKAKEDSTKNASEWGDLAAKKAGETKQGVLPTSEDGLGPSKAETEAAWTKANGPAPEPDAMHKRVKSDWVSYSPSDKMRWAEQVAKGGSTLSGSGSEGQAWSSPGIDAKEILRIVEEMTPEEYAKVMSGTSAASSQYRSDWLKARSAKDRADGYREQVGQGQYSQGTRPSAQG